MEVPGLEWRIKTPFRINVCGPSMAGKSVLLASLPFQNVFDRQFKKMMFCSPMLDDAGEYVDSLRTSAEERKMELAHAGQNSDRGRPESIWSRTACAPGD